MVWVMSFLLGASLVGGEQAAGFGQAGSSSVDGTRALEAICTPRTRLRVSGGAGRVVSGRPALPNPDPNPDSALTSPLTTAVRARRRLGICLWTCRKSSPPQYSFHVASL